MRIFAAVAALLLLNLMSQAQNETLKSRAEQTNYEETSRYDDVLRFFDELQRQSPLVRVQSFGASVEGRALPLVVLSDPPISEPRDARASGKPIVFVFANIHAGEVEYDDTTMSGITVFTGVRIAAVAQPAASRE